MKKNGLYTGSLLALALLAGSCDRDGLLEVEATEERQLVITPEETGVREEGETRSTMTGSTLTSGFQVGVALTDDGGSTYRGTSYQNVLFTQSSGTLTTSQAVRLGSEEATVYAYGPYSSSVTDITKVSVSRDDYVWGKATGVTKDNMPCKITFQHVNAIVRVYFKTGYSGTGKVTKLSIQGSCMGTSGTLNAKTGTLSASGSGSEMSASPGYSIGDGSTHYTDFTVVPTGSSGAITVYAIVDTKHYKVTTSSMTVKAGYIYTLNISGY